MMKIAYAGGRRDAPLIDTSSGRFRGEWIAEGTVARFLGVPYAQAPTENGRFGSPKACHPEASAWQSAASFGAASVQPHDPVAAWLYPPFTQQSEDCLTLNVWAPAGASDLPVLLWLHGGAWRVGAGSAPVMDGAALALCGAIVVTCNFRLGALGSLMHPDLIDESTGLSGNWQLQDQAAALRWLVENCAQFGGNAKRIVLIGQSAGAVSAALLAQNPALSSMISRVVMLSPSSNGARSLVKEDSVVYTERLATALNTNVVGLRSIEAKRLMNAECALSQTNDVLPSGLTHRSRSPVASVVDHDVVFGDWTAQPWPQHIPLLLANTQSEGAFFTDLYDPLTASMLTSALPVNLTECVKRTRQLLMTVHADSAFAEEVVEHYRACLSTGGDSQAESISGAVWVEIFGDFLCRRHVVGYAERLAGAHQNVRHATFKHRLLPPGKGTGHCADLPFWSSTYAHPYFRSKTGAGEDEAELSTIMMRALVSFAVDTTPMLSKGMDWPVLRSADRAVSFGISAPEAARVIPSDGPADISRMVSLAAIPKRAQLSIWEALAT